MGRCQGHLQTCWDHVSVCVQMSFIFSVTTASSEEWLIIDIAFSLSLHCCTVVTCSFRSIFAFINCYTSPCTISQTFKNCDLVCNTTMYISMLWQCILQVWEQGYNALGIFYPYSLGKKFSWKTTGKLTLLSCVLDRVLLKSPQCHRMFLPVPSTLQRT